MGAFDGVGDAPVARQGVTEPRRSGGDLFVEAEVLFDCGDADCELEALVEIGSHVILDDGEVGRVVIKNLRVIGERRFHVRDVVFGRHLAFDFGDVVGDRGEAALHGREDSVERCLALLCSSSSRPYMGSISRWSAGARVRRRFC